MELTVSFLPLSSAAVRIFSVTTKVWAAEEIRAFNKSFKINTYNKNLF